MTCAALVGNDLDLRNKTVLIRNSCVSVIFAIQKGSSSLQLQELEAIVIRECLVGAGCRMLALHVTGAQIIAKGVDRGSSEGAELLRGPAPPETSHWYESSLMQV